MTLRVEAGLRKGDGRADTSAFADDADAALGGAIVMGATIENHPAATFGAFLFWEHGPVFFRF